MIQKRQQVMDMMKLVKRNLKDFLFLEKNEIRRSRKRKICLNKNKRIIKLYNEQ